MNSFAAQHGGYLGDISALSHWHTRDFKSSICFSLWPSNRTSLTGRDYMLFFASHPLFSLRLPASVGLTWRKPKSCLQQIKIWSQESGHTHRSAISDSPAAAFLIPVVWTPWRPSVITHTYGHAHKAFSLTSKDALENEQHSQLDPTHHQDCQANFLCPTESSEYPESFWRHVEITVTYYQRKRRSQRDCSKKVSSYHLCCHQRTDVLHLVEDWCGSCLVWLNLSQVKAQNVILLCWLAKETRKFVKNF